MTAFRHAFRQILRHSGLAATVIALLAVGIGASSAMYSLIDQLILEPLPVPKPEELVSFSAPGLKPGETRQFLAVGGGTDPLFSYPMFRDLETEQDSLSVLSGLAAHHSFVGNLSYEAEGNLDVGLIVSGNYFGVLGLAPALGRLIGPQDDMRIGEGRVAVLSYAYWRDRLGADPNVIGKTLTVNAEPLTIIGIAPDGFDGTVRGFNASVFVPLTLRWLLEPALPQDYDDRQDYSLYLFGRLAPGVSRNEAQGQLNGLYRRILSNVDSPILEGVSEQEKEQHLAGHIVLEPGARGQVYTRLSASDPLTIALGVTLLVLMIVCGNVAILLLARGASRTAEMAIRASLGAARHRLIGQLLTESSVLAVIGGALSVPVAKLILRTVTIAFPISVRDRFGGLSAMNGSGIVMFAAGTALAAVVLFGLAPALVTSRTNTAGVIKAQSRQSAGGRGIVGFRSLLATSQISVSLVLLVLAGLFTRSLINVAQLDFGMNVDSVVGVNVSPGRNGLQGAEAEALYDRMREEFAALPGVESVASLPLPLLMTTSVFDPVDVSIVGSDQQLADGAADVSPMVSPGFFETLSIPLLSGRDFTEADETTNSNIVIVNESFVRKFDLGPNAVGKTVLLSGRYVPQGPAEIVGIVGDAQNSFMKGPIPPQVYTPHSRTNPSFNSRVHYVRADLELETLASMIQAAMQRVDPSLPANISPLSNVVSNRTSDDRLMSILSVAFASLATVLAAVGLYAVLAFSVTQRRRELGLRLALGASPQGLRMLVLKHVGAMALAGGAFGLAVALAGGRLVQAQLYGISGFDPLVVLLATSVLGATLFLAGYFPARRASNIAPMEALRYE